MTSPLLHGASPLSTLITLRRALTSTFFSDFIFNCAEKEGPFVVYSELEKRRSRNYKKKWVKTLNKVKEEIRLSHIWGKL